MFEWHEAKSRANLKARGFDFADAAAIFAGPTLEMDDAGVDDGERRVQAIGRAGGDVRFVVTTWRGGIRRTLPARLANRSGTRHP